jgi:hypothetical protein
MEIHSWQLIACSNNSCAAALISYFESILNHESGVQDFKSKFDDKAERAASLISDSGIPCKFSILRQETMSFWGDKKISESLLFLETLGFISILPASDPFNRTKYIRFHPEACNAWIRANYDNQGNYIGFQEKNHNKDIEPDRSFENASSKKPKGASIIVERAGEINSSKNLQDKPLVLGKQNSDTDTNQRQDADYADNAKRPHRDNFKDLSMRQKGILNINQFTNSINLNQRKLKNKFILQDRVEERGDRTKKLNDHPVVNALVKAGLAAEKFEYPDVLPSILELQGKGATVETYTKAYDKAVQVNNGKGFGIKYLNKVVEDILRKESRSSVNEKQKSKKMMKSPNPQEADVCRYENDLNKALQWATPFLNSAGGEK